MINNTFTEVIQKAFQKKPGGKDHKLVQDVSKEYKIPTESTGKLKIESKDEKTFEMSLVFCPRAFQMSFHPLILFLV